MITGKYQDESRRFGKVWVVFCNFNLGDQNPEKETIKETILTKSLHWEREITRDGYIARDGG